MISNRVLSLGLVLVLLMGLLPASPMSAVTYALAEEVETSQKAEDSPEGDSSDEHELPSKPAESVAPEQSQAPALEESPDESTGDKPDPSTDDEDHFNPSGNIEANLQELSDISEGYAVVLTDKSPILKKAKKGSDRIAFLSKKDIVYVSNRIFKDADNPGNDWVFCHFDSKRGVIDGYMRLRRLEFLTEKATKKFLIKFADSDEYSVYDGHPLARIECNFTAAFEPGSEPLPVADLRPSAASEQEMVSTPEPESSQAHDPVAALGLEGSADLTQSLQPEEPTQSIDAAPVPVQLETVPDRPGADADSQSGVAAGEGESGIANLTSPAAIVDEYSVVTLSDAPLVESITLHMNSPYVRVGDSVEVSVQVNPADAGQELVWTSNKTDIATVTDGIVTGLAPGRVTITATATDGSRVKGTLVVSVYRPVTSITFNQSSGSLLIGKTLKLSATVAPQDATYKTIVWESSDPAVATVSDKGLVTAIGSGEAVITARTDFGATGSEIATFVLTVAPAVESIVLSAAQSTLRIGDSVLVTAEVTPADAGQELVWTSNKTDIATVTDGIVTGLAPGRATITATATDGSRVKGTLVVSVYRPVTSITFNQSSGSLLIGKTLKLSATVAPQDATYKTIVWESSDPAVATVSDKGLVTAIGSGEAVITGRADFGATGSESATFVLTVAPAVESIVLSAAQNTLRIGDSVLVTAEVTPADAGQELVWTSNKTDIATVTDGIVTGVAPGRVTITATATDGSRVKGTLVVSVYKPVTSITLNQSSGSLLVGKTLKLSATVVPEDATYKTIVWESSNPSVATVSDKGLVTAIGSGEAVITARTDFGATGSESATFVLTVAPAVESIVLSAAQSTLRIGDSVAVTAEVNPADAGQGLVWTSNKTDIATVTDGTVTGVAPGRATITATATDGSKVKGTLVVSVYRPVTSITLNQSSGSLLVGKTLKLSATVAPEDATYKTIVWESSNPSVATVSDKGLVTAIGSGEAVITARTDFGATGSESATFVLTVSILTANISLSMNPPLLKEGGIAAISAAVLPDGASQVLIWSSSDAGIATVVDGAVTGVAPGSTTITATATDGSGISGTLTISVYRPVTSIALDQPLGSLKVGETLTLTALIQPEDATYKAIRWESSDPNVAAVDINGVVTAVSVGDVTLTANTDYGAIGDESAECALTVIDQGQGTNDFTYAITDNEVAITGYTGSGGAITIPASIGGLPVKAIADHAFGWNANITSVVVPDGLNVIGTYVFENCFNITSITLPDSVTSIGRDAFGGCYALKSMDLPDGITRIEHATFNQCIGLENVSIPAGVTFIGDQAFNHCYSLSGVILPEGITSIEAEMFRGDAMLESIEIPEGVTSIGDYAFDGCSALASAYIPASVTSISNSAFAGCGTLTIYGYAGSTAEAYANDHGIPFIVHMDFTYTISNDEVAITGYIGMGGDIVIPPTIEGFPVRTIVNSVFEGNCDISSVTVLAEVRSIGERVFADCSSISAIELPDSVTLIGPEAFSGCTQLVRMNLPENLTRIERGMFSLCRDLEKVSIPAGVTFIGEQAFSDCEELRRIGLPEGLIYIEAETFRGDWRLGSIVFPDGVTGIGNGAFDSCGSLDSAYIPTSVQLIGESSFSGCDNLTIYGYAGSFAQSYASEHSIPFVDRTGQVAFSQPRYYETDGVIFIVVRTADFNADGDLDFAAICYHNDEPGDPNKVIVFLGNGDGTFDAAHTYIVGTTPIGLKIADFNKDGNADLAVACMWSNTIAILLGNGDGSFTGPTYFDARQFPSDIVITDFDGDGDLDIATPNSWMECVSILKGDGQGNFTLTDTTYEAGGSSSQMMDTADLNNDGLMDIVVVNAYSPGIGILFGNGDGSFQSPEVLTTHDHPFDAKVGDINHDGVLDIVVTNEESRDLSVLIGNGDGTFQSAVQYPTNSGRIELTDLNSDGNVDVAISALYGDYASILLGNGDGTFQNAFTIPTANYWCQGVASGDFNGDGKIDLVLAQEDNVCVLLNK